jgi:hypothetical protein
MLASRRESVAHLEHVEIRSSLAALVVAERVLEKPKLPEPLQRALHGIEADS